MNDGMAQSSAIFLFLRYSLGDKVDMSMVVANIDWQQLYSFATKQTIIGICFDGIKRLSEEYPEELKKNPIGRELLMTWMGKAQQIRRQNMKVNSVASKLFSMLRKDGLRCCILKGQGNALMYGNPYSRNPGDVDVWVNASREDIRVLAQSLAKGKGCVKDESLNHIELEVNGVAVELHSTPAIMNNPVYNHRLQKWLKRNADLQCSNIVSLPDNAGDVAVPTSYFNCVYQLFHLYHHYFYEGVGLRQIVDYYYVVSMFNVDCVMFNSLQRELKHLGLWKFAGAVMYVLYVVLGLPEERMIRPMDVKRGRVFLDEILSGGNFGHYDTRMSFGNGAFGHNMQRLYRDLRLAWYYPAEALSEPIFRVWHFFWRMKNNK